MRSFKRALAVLMAVALLACVPVAVSAEEVAPAQEVFAYDVLHSITVEETTGSGVAFLFEMNVRGAAVNARNEFVNTNAVATVGGVDYSVVSMGAVVTNQAAYIANIDNLTREDVNDDQTVLDIPAKYMFAIGEDTCSFAARIIHIPELAYGIGIACRPYCVLKDAEGNEMTLYGGSDICTYNMVYYQNAEEEIPVWDVAVDNVDDRLSASVTAEYAAICPTTYREGFKVALTLENVSANAATSAGDSVTYAIKDAEGNELATETVAVGALTPGDSKVVEFYAPINAAIIEQVDAALNYVPAITLPEIGSDIDVTKKKNRIRVSAASASFNEDGTIAVSLTFQNYTTNWITEETNYVNYTYYDASGTGIKTETLYIGCIDTKKNKVKTFTFNVPANAASVKITSSKIVYWTEWA